MGRGGWFEPVLIRPAFEEKSGSDATLYLGPWNVIIAAMAEESDPPQKKFGFKPRTFEVVNHTPATSPPGDASSGSTDNSARIEIRDLYQHAASPGPVLSRSKVAAETEIHRVLRDNLARENAAGVNALKPKPKRRSKRTRDYFLILTPLLLFFGMMAFGSHRSAIHFVCGIAGMVLSIVTLTWLMFFVMDDY